MTVSKPPPLVSAPQSELARLRRRFIGLMITQAVLGAAAVMFAVVYFVLHLAWGLPAFAMTLAVAVAAQVRFIWMFKTSEG